MPGSLYLSISHSMGGFMAERCSTGSDDLPKRLREAAESLHLPPSIQNQKNIRAMNACDDAAKEIERLRGVAQASGNRPDEAIENLTHHQVQCDEDGVMIQVSRQALDDLLRYVSGDLANISEDVTPKMVSAGMAEIPEDGREYEHVEAAYRAMRLVALTSTHLSPPWDAHYNRSYEPVETLAKEIYDFFDYREAGTKPAWVPGGNSLMQDEARICARRQLRDAGNTPEVTSTNHSGEAK